MDSFRLARDTWGDIRPVVHYSSSRRLHEDAGAKEQAHADYIYDNALSRRFYRGQLRSKFDAVLSRLRDPRFLRSKSRVLDRLMTACERT